jgi:hypothetical protein
MTLEQHMASKIVQVGTNYAQSSPDAPFAHSRVLTCLQSRGLLVLAVRRLSGLA